MERVVGAYEVDINIEEVLEKLGNWEEGTEREREEEVRDALTEVTKELVETMVDKPKKFWDVIRGLRQQRSHWDIPEWMHGEGGYVGDRSGLERLWKTEYERKEWEPKTEEGKKWRLKVRQEVERWEKVRMTHREVDRVGGERITAKELRESRAGTKKDAAPGSDLVTGRMKEEAGQSFEKTWVDFLNKMLESEEVPDQFKEDVVVPILKKGSRFVVKNYRPVSLVQTTLKDFQKIMYGRVNKSESGKLLTGEFNFGSVKGRDRHLSLWVVNTACLWEMYTKEHGGQILTGLWDVKGAYPSIWQDGVDWLMWQAGIRGKLWRVLRKMEKGLRGQIRLNGNFVKMKIHEDGGNQGAVSPPHRWKFLMGAWLKHCLDKGLGVKVGDVDIPGTGYVDDATMMAYKVDTLGEMYKQREIFGDLWGFTWETSKDQILVRGCRRGMAGIVASMAVRGMKVKDHALVLGEWIGWNPDRCPRQVVEVVKKLKAASRTLEWSVWKGSVIGSDLLEALFETMVTSIATTHLIHTRLLESEIDLLDSVKAGVGKKFLGIPKWASRWGVLAELGWSTIGGKVVEAKLGFYGRIRRSDPEGIVGKLLDFMVRELDKEEGGESLSSLGGFLVQVRDWMGVLGLEEFWGTGPFMKKGKWKEVVRDKVREWERRKWGKWRQSKRLNEDWLLASKDVWGKEKYVGKGTKRDRRLVAGIRMMVTRVGQDREEEQGCRFCGKSRKETGTHLVLECEKWAEERRRVTGPGTSTVSNRWKKLTDGGSASLPFLTKVSEDYREEAGAWMVPWVAVLGKSEDQGGVEALVVEVSKWLGTREF